MYLHNIYQYIQTIVKRGHFQTTWVDNVTNYKGLICTASAHTSFLLNELSIPTLFQDNPI